MEKESSAHVETLSKIHTREKFNSSTVRQVSFATGPYIRPR